MRQRGTTCSLFVMVASVLAVFAARNLGATPPVPVETVTGCVKDGRMIIQAPERFKRERPLKISPCTNIPFDFAAAEGRQIRARGGIDLYNSAFVCPTEVALIGDCPPGVCNPAWPCDSTPCGRADPGSVSLPPDFEMAWLSGPLHADWGGRLTITVQADGSVTEREQAQPAARGKGPEETITRYRLSQSQVRQLYAQVVACRFFELEKRYWNRSIMDGESSSLSVVAGGRTHEVTTYYYIVSRFNGLAGLFLETCRTAREGVAGKSDARRERKVEESSEVTP